MLVGLMIALGIVALHSYSLHSCIFSSLLFCVLLLEDKHRFKFGGVISGILYHLERSKMAWIGVLKSSICVFLTRFRVFLHFRV